MAASMVSAADTAAIAAGAALFAPTLALVAYAWRNRSYQPIRAKNLPQTTLMAVCGALWFVGNVAANGHVAAAGAWAQCRLWHVWIRVGFKYLFFCSVLCRILALYWLFVRRKKFHGWSSFSPLAILAPCVVVYCLVGQLAAPAATVRYDPATHLCLQARAYRFGGVGLLWAVWVLVIVFTWLSRDIQASFNEARESVLVAAALLASMLATTVSETISRPVAAHLAPRVAGTLIDAAAANCVVWIVLGYPVYQSLFNRKRYSANWRTQLVSEGFRREYGISLSTIMGAGSVYSMALPPTGSAYHKGSAEGHREPSWIFRHSLPVRFSQTFGKLSTDTVPSIAFSNSTVCGSASASWAPSDSTELPRAMVRHSRAAIPAAVRPK
ncbi:hypothetical protein H4R19_000499 [Coemansia spiralis]|nr:hypothetical protein H4R19_000499 [Coemansia spiralis]